MVKKKYKICPQILVYVELHAGEHLHRLAAYFNSEIKTNTMVPASRISKFLIRKKPLTRKSLLSQIEERNISRSELSALEVYLYTSRQMGIYSREATQ